MFVRHFLFSGLITTLLLLAGVAAVPVLAQSPAAGAAADDSKRYVLGGVTISGTRYLDPNTLIGLSGLQIGDPINVPGEEIGKAIRKLWTQGILADVSVGVARIEGDKIYLDFNLKERPRLSKFTFEGIRKGQAEEVGKKITLIRGKVVTDALLNNTRTQVRKFFVNKGFLDTKVNVTQRADSALSNSVALVINVDRGEKVRIHDIEFEGATAFKERKLKRQLKKTKERQAWKILTPGKFQQTEFDDDKLKLIEFYNAEGYRDATVVSDTVVRDAKGLTVRLKVDEGPKYYFRNITWSGNYLYDSRTLANVLGIKPGSAYSKETLDKRLNYNPTGQDVTSLYMNDGYLFFEIEPVETKVEGDSIDIEMRLREGVQAHIREINISGNTKTSDHVLRRTLRTLPGDKFNRELLIRSQREIATLGYFDPEKIGINPIPNAVDGTVDINYTVEEKPSDQITLSGGWGGFAGFIGTVGLVFNNFSMRKASNFKNWTPVPGGDGQRVALNIQANGLQFQSYSLSFTEPWLGGRRPNSFSFSLNRQVQRPGVSRLRNDGNADQFIKVNSATIGLGRQLRVPDDYFSLSNSLSVSQYETKNFPLLPGAGDGFFNNVTLNTTLTRNSIDNPTFTRRGSSVSLSLNLTPPYSLINPQVDALKFIEFHKWMFDASWFTPVIGKLVLNTRAHFGFLGNYNKNRQVGPFERFRLGGAGLGFGGGGGGGGGILVGTDFVGLRGYDDPQETFSIPTARQGEAGGLAYNKYVMELRYPVSLNPAATVFVLGFAEAGNAFNSFSEYNPYKLYRSAGVGARIFMSAFGLLGFDFAVPYDTVAPRDATSKQDRTKFHFIIGQQIR